MYTGFCEKASVACIFIGVCRHLNRDHQDLKVKSELYGEPAQRRQIRCHLRPLGGLGRYLRSWIL